MIELLIAGALITTPPAMQDPAAPATEASPVTLEDVTVTGRTLERLIQDFVLEVAEPNKRRGLARWEDRICIGVTNLRQETAQYLADRVSTVAEDIGLTAGEPGCTPNILIAATDDGSALARTLVDTRRRAFRMGGSGMDRGGAALRDFVETDRPVRWWQMSLPVNSETGEQAVRLPGNCFGSCTGDGSALHYAPEVQVFAASRQRTQIVDRLIRTVVIVDVDDVSHLSILQLADYIAMVALAQIDPDADTTSYASILNVMEDPSSATSLMDWDIAYLEGLYASEGNAVSRLTNRQEVIDSIRDAHATLRETAAEEAPGRGQGVTP